MRWSFVLIGSFEDNAIFRVFTYLSIMDRYNPSPSSKLSWNTWKMPISSKLPVNKRRRSTQCIILSLFLLFSQIKMGDRNEGSKLGVKNTSSKLRLKKRNYHVTSRARIEVWYTTRGGRRAVSDSLLSPILGPYLFGETWPYFCWTAKR